MRARFRLNPREDAPKAAAPGRAPQTHFRRRPRRVAMLGLTRNAVFGLNLYCGGAGLAAGGHPPAAGVRKEPREGDAAGAPEARPAPLGAEGPDALTPSAAGAATPARGWLFRPGRCSSWPAPPPEEAAAAMLSPEEELDGDEPEAAAKRPAGLPRARPALRLAAAASASASGANADGSLPPTPPPADDDEPEGAGDGAGQREGGAGAGADDALYRLSLDIISRYLREQASGLKDAAPGPDGRRALDTLRRVGDGVQRNHRTAFQGAPGPPPPRRVSASPARAAPPPEPCRPRP